MLRDVKIKIENLGIQNVPQLRKLMIGLIINNLAFKSSITKLTLDPLKNSLLDKMSNGLQLFLSGEESTQMLGIDSEEIHLRN